MVGIGEVGIGGKEIRGEKIGGEDKGMGMGFCPCGWWEGQGHGGGEVGVDYWVKGVDWELEKQETRKDRGRGLLCKYVHSISSRWLIG